MTLKAFRRFKATQKAILTYSRLAIRKFPSRAKVKSRVQRDL